MKKETYEFINRICHSPYLSSFGHSDMQPIMLAADDENKIVSLFLYEKYSGLTPNLSRAKNSFGEYTVLGKTASE